MEYLGAYEETVLRALEAEKPAPWSVDDLLSPETLVAITECAVSDRTCDAAAIRDWLRCLSDDEKRDVIDQLNKYSRTFVGA